MTPLMCTSLVGAGEMLMHLIPLLKLLYKRSSNIPTCLLYTIITTASHKALSDLNTSIHFQPGDAEIKAEFVFPWGRAGVLKVVTLGF